MSSDKLPSALSISQHQQSTPRGPGGSILQHTKKIPDSQPSLQQVLPNPTTSASTQSYSTQYTYSSENTNYMNSQGNSAYGALEYGHPHHLSQGQPPTPQTATSGGALSSFPPQPPILQPTYQQSSHAVFPQFSFPSPNGVSSPAGQPGVSGPMSVHPNQQLLPLPQNTSMTPNHSPLASVSAGGQQAPASATSGAYSNQPFDTTGQMAPTGMKPRVAATLWEDEGSLCFQVEARGVCVARREDNHMINGTKLLNVAGMTRGRRDGILKSEKVRHVVKIGPMHLKGVWIPFERALDFANKEKITELLYPLFVHNIGAFLYHPTNTHRTSAVMAAAERRRQDGGNPNVLSQSQALNQGSIQRRGPSDLISSSQPPPLHAGMHNPIHTPLPPHPNLAQPRPGLERSMSFPTPPSSASSVMGGVNGDGSSFGWNGNMVSNVGGAPNQPLALDTLNSRSMPTTPATTPPGALQQLQQYPPPPTSSIYQNGPGGLSQQNIAQQNMQRFNQSLPQPSQYMSQPRDSNTMGPPPTSRGAPQTLSRPSSRQDDNHVKEDGEEPNGLVGEHEEHAAQEVHGEEDGENDGDHAQEEEYTTHDGNYQNGHRPYYPAPLATTEHTPHLSPEMSGSPNHVQGPSTPARSSYGGANVNVPRTVDNASGATPRTTTTPQQQWVQNSTGYQTPPRTNSSNGPIRATQRYQLVTGDPTTDHCDVNGTGTSDVAYPGQQGLGGVTMPSQAPPQNYPGLNGTPGSNKRLREVDDDDEHSSRPSSRGHDERSGETDGVGGIKRRRTIREGSTPSTGMGTAAFDRNSEGRLNRTRSAVGPRVRR